ncbi:MAG: hypothetical protein ACRERD_12835 [Candidatus Binatia bacterium]
MAQDHGHVMLVGSIARPEDGWSVEDVFRNSAKAIGNHVSMLPDGEIGDRYYWINYVALRTYAEHPDMVTTSRHTVDDWKPKAYADHWQFTLKPGVKELHFNKIGYADEAKKSYQIFRTLRDERIIPKGVKFMVALPAIESATRPFIDTPEHFEILWKAYGEAIVREVKEIVEAIPHQDLALQWDLAVEVIVVEGAPGLGSPISLNALSSDPMQRYCDGLALVCQGIPEDVWLGLHLCYGSLEHKPGETTDSGYACEIKDLNVSVNMANAGAKATGRSVQFVHMPVQFSNGFKESFYEPLKRLNIGGAHPYLGLIHLHDGVDGALKRIAVAKKYLPVFGVATPCGWGRRPLNEKIEDLLQLHRTLAEKAIWPTGPLG